MLAWEGFTAPATDLADQLLPPLAVFTRTGFTGGLNWYRDFDRNWELTATTPAPADADAVHRRQRRPGAELTRATG